MMSVDLNCDMGEGIEGEDLLMPYISSANIACGSHAGDEDTMRLTIQLALAHGVAIGAHPSYPDRKNFGRVDIFGNGLDPSELLNSLCDQLYIFQKIVNECGAILHHIKPHGALYNRAAKDETVSALICQAIRDTGSVGVLYGLGRSITEQVAERFDIRFYHEVFADRSYQDDGSLTPRNRPDALITDTEKVCSQVWQMLNKKTVTSVSGSQIALQTDTICIHGDGPHALQFAKDINQMLKTNGYSISAI